ncbi:prephenate dehydratase [Arsenicicoccus sp. oral taxon 190]|uniref:prephenate dehydratase n=1 Tax=Arsenicicoccus sp. oral taxon 190 TaxID=1658671 RepID=UPI00067A3BA7|nr:prephenate dehydratase [Arsenicicoccus sp. oral taxon 190]AKT50627.1 prephenate dehydratase [Arsenicicoccus sp. oral taxon 190]
MRYAYLGPAGTFTEQALLQRPEASAPDAERVPYGSVDAALAALRAGDVDAAVVPIENSVEGGVSATLDALATGDPLVVIGEILVPITFVLAARAGTTLADVRAVGTHSHAWAQVRGWMSRRRPEPTYVPTLSTAAAAAGLASGDDSPYDAAVCAPVAATVHGLQVLASDIGDNAGAVTRFVLVARPGEAPAPTGADKTTMVLFQRADHPGGLLTLLEQFAARGINLTRLESRPTGEGMGRYCFSIDVEGHLADERVGEALMGLRRVCADVRYLGSYPRADRLAATVELGTSDDDFVAARDWLHALRTPQATPGQAGSARAG